MQYSACQLILGIINIINYSGIINIINYSGIINIINYSGIINIINYSGNHINFSMLTKSVQVVTMYNEYGTFYRQ